MNVHARWGAARDDPRGASTGRGEERGREGDCYGMVGHGGTARGLGWGGAPGHEESAWPQRAGKTRKGQQVLRAG